MGAGGMCLEIFLPKRSRNNAKDIRTNKIKMLWLQQLDLPLFLFLPTLDFYQSCGEDKWANKLHIVWRKLGETCDSVTTQSRAEHAHAFRVVSCLKVKMASFPIFKDACMYTSEGEEKKRRKKNEAYLPTLLGRGGGLCYLNHNDFFYSA